MNKLVVYYRISNDKSGGESSYGISAQQQVISTYVEQTASTVMKEFTDIASGAKENREQLTAAINYCHITNSRLCVARLDRLSRDLELVAKIAKDDELNLVVADSPNMSRLELHLKAIIAMEERAYIAQRTKAALKVKMEREGWKAGNPNLAKVRNTDTTAARKSMLTNAKKRNERLRGIINLATKETSGSLRAIATYLNDKGFVTSRKRAFTAIAVKRVITALEAA